ncbi:MAG: N-acetylmannosamine-6-phosphate 2-epimerase [Brevibacillus sp.]|nr:N-acetylmannosamine-6-phosphate 2-epimerase [Brevibacillus sp.]
MLEKLKAGLVVSCQALEDEPLHGPQFMERMARAAQEGGAVGIRANGFHDIRAIRTSIDLPIIGINKRKITGFDAFITPAKEDARLVQEAGADIIAIDATTQSRPESLEDLIRYIKVELGKAVMADVSTVADGIRAQQLGCDLVGTTLAGYTYATMQKKSKDPDFDLLRGLVAQLHIPVIAEGRIHTPDQARKALQLGAFCVVVGGAITRPQEITRRFLEGMKE